MNQLLYRPAVLHDVPALLPMMAAFNAGEGIAFSTGGSSRRWKRRSATLNSAPRWCLKTRRDRLRRGHLEL